MLLRKMGRVSGHVLVRKMGRMSGHVLLARKMGVIKIPQKMLQKFVLLFIY